jgi:hypothetical protein
MQPVSFRVTSEHGIVVHNEDYTMLKTDFPDGPSLFKLVFPEGALPPILKHAGPTHGGRENHHVKALRTASVRRNGVEALNHQASFGVANPLCRRVLV